MASRVVIAGIKHPKWTSYPRFLRHYSSQCGKEGLVLGAYVNDTEDDIVLTSAAKKFNELSKGKFLEDLKTAGPVLKKGKARVFYNLQPEFPVVAAVGLGKKDASYNELEELDEQKEAIRVAAAVGCQSLQAVDVTTIAVEELGNAEAAAEGAALGIWKYQGFKNKQKVKPLPQLTLHGNEKSSWQKGLMLAEAQNLARRLMDTPANYMTPTIFAEEATNVLRPLGVEVVARNKAWIEELKMCSFLSVAKGSCESPVFLEITYSGGKQDEKPIVLVGKGVTFDSGGISIKSAAAMDEMRADMGGAACVVSTIHAVAAQKLPVNVKGLIPLCENMPSGSANKPGDVVTAMNGKTILVDNTDAEGRLILADALCYSAQFCGKFVLDIATLTGAIRVALGQSATGVFSNSNVLWKQLQKAGADTGDRVWRMPLWQHFTNQVADYPSADLNNVGKAKVGGSCTAAAFLKEFVPKGDWLHLDIAGVMGPAPSEDMPYLVKGMTGRPTRTLAKFIELQIKH
ncbi:cytosol aminopeptidase [Anabrus simplex]|uniref:cytosol aminopeptidase n=1 Tax=Anabrus simplex TaxID=316456 RepID=UPI0035A2C0C3